MPEYAMPKPLHHCSIKETKSIQVCINCYEGIQFYYKKKIELEF